MTRISILIWCVLITPTAKSQTLQELLDQSNTNWEAEKYELAFQNLSSAVESAKAAYAEDPEGYGYSYAVVLNQMGIRLYQAQNYETAATYYQAAIPVFKEVQGENGQDYLVSVENLAICYDDDGRYLEALEYYQLLLSNETYQKLAGSNIYQTYNSAAICAYQANEYKISKAYYEKALGYLNETDGDYWTITENQILLESSWGKYAEAYPLITKLIAKYPEKETVYSNDIAYYNRDLGLEAFSDGDFTKAIPYFKETIKHLQPTDSIAKLSIVYIYGDISSAYSTLGNYVEGMPYMEKNADQVKEYYGANTLEYAYALTNLTVGNTELGAYKKAKKYYREAYKIIEQLPQSDQGEIQSLYDVNYADFLVQQGDYDKAQFHVERAYTFYNQDDSKYLDDKIYALNYLGIVLVSKGDYDQAESVLKQSLNLQLNHQGLENEMGTKIASNLTSLYIQTGRISRAEKFLQFILANDLNIHGKNSFEYSFSLQVAGVLYLKTSNYERAISYLTEAYNVRKPLVGDNNRELLRLRKTLGTAYLKGKDYTKAIAILNEVLDAQISSLGNNHVDVSLTQNDLGLAYLLNDQSDKAVKLFEKSYAIDKRVLGQYNQFTITPLFNLACANVLMTQNETAAKYFQQAIDDYLHILNEYFPHLSEKERLEYYHTIKGQLGAYFSFLTENLETNPEYAETLYNLQIQTKAMLLNESLQLKKSLEKSDDPAIVSAFNQWSDINKKVAKLEQIAKSEKAFATLDSLKIVGEEYERALNAASNNSINSEQNTWKEIAASLREDEVAIEIIRVRHFDFKKNEFDDSKTKYLALIIDRETASHPKFVLLRDGYAMDSKYFNVYKNSMKFKKQDKLSYNYFWKPIAQAISKYKKAYISSDGVYHLLNINTLFNPESSQYVLNEFEVEIVSNTNELLSKKQQESSFQNATLFGFPNFNAAPDTEVQNEQRSAIYQEIFSSGVSDLPETKTEVENIGSMMAEVGISTKEFLANEAGERQLKSIESSDILHIATHGFFEESSSDVINDDPLMHSGLLLANLKETTTLREENGILTAKEVANMNLSGNKLVVLSACETGRGKVVNGEGVYGLQRAFQVAGAQNVIISLWKVDDTATQKLMTFFYDNYLSSKDPRSALKQSQLQLQKEYPHPNYWGAFYVVGQ